MKPPLHRIEEFLDATMIIDREFCEQDSPTANKTIHKLEAALREAVDYMKYIQENDPNSGHACAGKVILNHIADILDGGEK